MFLPIHIHLYNEVRDGRGEVRMKRKILLGVLAASLLVFVSGCEKTVFGKEYSGELKSSHVKIKKDNAKELKLELNIGAGELTVNSGAKDWVNGTAKYSHTQLKPKVSYKLQGKKGIGVIEQKDTKLKALNNYQNKWKFKLNNKSPLDLKVNSGASNTTLDLEGLKLNSLDVNAGVGNVTIDLGGKWKKDFNAKLKMGVGKSTIIVPANVGVKIKSEKGLGKSEFVGLISKGNGVYVNEAYGKEDVTINIQTDQGVGETIFKVEK
jgi:hypothetical protein